MNQISVIGWCDCWTSPYRQVPFTDERRNALVVRIRKRKYNFPYAAHQNLPYCAPFYSDNVLCALTKSQWDSVIAEAYKDMPLGDRLMPMDVINSAPINSVLYEKEKFIPKGDDKNV